jgi:hypothetical protein
VPKSVERGPLEASSRSAIQEIPRSAWNPQVSTLCSQECANAPSPVAHEFTVHSHNLIFLKIRFSIILTMYA